MSAAAAAAGEDIPLLSGWNLISLPRQPDSVDPAAVFSSIAGSFTIVHSYDACDTADPWRTYNPAVAPGDNDLTAVDHRPGLWVRATAAATLAISSTEPAETTIHLCPGWNLIGYPLAQPRPVLAALSSIAGKFRRVYGWNPADPVDPWEVFDVAVPAWANDLEQMQPGRGYWLYATEGTTLVMSNAGLPPEVTITAPANAAAVTAPTDVIGTVKSDLLEQWTLAYRLKGETVSTTFATGNTPVTNGVLGKLDPTLLLNGLYEIELTATDFQGQSMSTTLDVVVEGNLKIGNFTLSFVDLEVPLAGLPIQVIRTYDSRDKRVGDFGVGWTLSVSKVRLQEDGPVGENWQGTRSPGAFPTYCIRSTRDHVVTVTLPDDRVLRFRPKLTPECQQLAPPQVVNISYVPVPGTLGTLEALDQNPQALVVGSFPGPAQLWDQDGVELEDPGRYRLTTKDGRAFVIDQSAGLINLTDLNENTLTFSRNGINHSSGEGVTFERDAQGKITRIRDLVGGSLTYSYNTSVDLAAATDREEATTRFTYDLNHHLLSIQDPLGRQPIRNEYDDSGRLVSTTDAFGKTIDLTHSLAESREVITDRLGHSRVLEYDARGNVICETDALGKVTTRTFDGNDLLLSETNPLGHTTRYIYDASRNLIEKEDPLGNRTRSTYNALGKVLTATDELGHTTVNTYDASGNLLRVEDPLGSITAYTYDSRGNLLSETDAEGGVTRFEYDGRGNVVREVDAVGTEARSTYDSNGHRLTQTATRTTATGTETLTWRYSYDQAGRLTATTDAKGDVSRTEYDALGNVAATIDKLGRRTSFAYDELGRQTRTDYPDGTSDLRSYDSEGRLLASTDQAGRTTTYTYDAVGRLLTTTFPDGASMSNVYDDAGRLVESRDPRGNLTRYGYDAAGLRTSVIDALSQQTIFGYDAAGNEISIRDARGNTTGFEYDDAGRLVRTVYPDGTDREAEYDGLERLVAETDQAGIVTRFGYDPLGRLTTVTDALGQVTRHAYDEQGNLISQIDANGHETRFEYDAVGLQTRRVLPDGASERFAYDAVGNLERTTTFGGATIQYSYDAMRRLLSRAFPGASAAFTYTATGQRKTAVDVRGTTFYEYDNRDRLSRMVYPDGRELRYAWDAAGNRTELTAGAGATTATTTFAYDALNRLQTVTDPLGKVYTLEYDPNGNRASLEYPNGITTEYTFDRLNRLTELSTVRGRDATVVQRYAYTLGAAGNRRSVEEADGTVRQYGYDGLYRLTSETVSSTVGEIYRKMFGYDPVGNRITQEHRAAAGTPTTKVYTYDTRDRQLSEGSTSYTWDIDGRLTAKSGAASYSWDLEDRLTQAVLADGTVARHTYDVDGVRVRTEATDAGGATTTTEYLVDTSGPLSQVVAEGSNTTEVATLYVRGDDLLAVILGGGTTTQTRYYHADGLGSIRALTDETGEITDRYTFTAFGELLSHEGETHNAYLFAGEQLDPNVGWYYNRARWMDPGIGRFATTDPLLGALSDPVSLHRYLYAAASPQLFVDPTGEEFTLGGLQISVGIQGYLASVAISYVVGKVISAVYLGITEHNLAGFRWFEWTDLLSLIPGAFLANVVKLPVQMVVRVGGKVVGKAFVAQGVPRVLAGFSKWFASTGGKLFMRSADGAIIQLESGNAKAGFKHILQRHLTAFWNGSKPEITTFWPSNVSPGQMLNLLKEAAGKFIAGGPVAQSIVLSNGITAKLVVIGGKVITFYPESGPGIIFAKALIKALP